jgi:hypothetical protein
MPVFLECCPQCACTSISSHLSACGLDGVAVDIACIVHSMYGICMHTQAPLGTFTLPRLHSYVLVGGAVGCCSFGLSMVQVDSTFSASDSLKVKLKVSSTARAVTLCRENGLSG